MHIRFWKTYFNMGDMEMMIGDVGFWILDIYKKISQRYKEAEKNGSGKEYRIYTDIVIFEGVYQNGKRHLSGKK